MDNRKLAIVGANAPITMLIDKAKSLGYETHVFAWQCGDPGEKEADYFYPISIDKKDERIRIGIQSHFDFDVETMNPVGLFCITILTWDAKSWEKFENKVTERYGKNTNNSVPQKHVELPTIEQKNFDNEESFHKEIIDKLKECYDFLKEITDNIDK